jgi:gamma-glutamylcyclotransferase (GGCT)/AIG2-like uncharacterized protein YtfP
VFFYGTLLPEFVPPAMRDVVAPLHFCGEGSVRGVLFDLGEYPGAVFDEMSDKRVYGAVFQLPVDSGVLEKLDRYEGYEHGGHTASLFVRKLQPIDVADGATMECWVYEYNGNPQGVPLIASGRYRGQVSSQMDPTLSSKGKTTRVGHPDSFFW